jgi:type I restriction enzyme M protein
MALKKSQLYSSLWSSCDELRGGMDASQYKDYVLTLLFMKYVSDKYAGKHGALEVPAGGGFADMAKLKGDKQIGDKINIVIGRFAGANDLKGVIDLADFADEDRLGKGKEMQDRLSKLVAIFEGLDFRANRADGDDLLGDAYEYLMRHFATESGKSKGQFYTPAEVSRILAKVIGIGPGTRQDQTIYDPTCGSGSLLLKAADEAPRGITIYGQENDNATWALARMNMILHSQPTADLWKGNSLSAPYFLGPSGGLRTFDFAVANPPFSAKAWSSGLDPAHDEFERFADGIPPAKNGDYAFLLHVIKSLKSTGKAAVILPHGVLFRGHREAGIRRNLVKRGLIKGIIGLPPNLFYGTAIPACIVVIDKQHARARTGIFVIDASKGFVKDGNKNRLREQDIHRIVDVFNRQLEVPGYSRMVPVAEIADPANDYNLNLPRYIDATEPEDLHDLDAHLRGGIPNRDVDALAPYWQVFPSLRAKLFAAGDRPGYRRARVETDKVKATILAHPEFRAFSDRVAGICAQWQVAHRPVLERLRQGSLPREVIVTLSEDLLARFADLPLLSQYDVYQRLMDYWAEVMQDDVYLIAAEDWNGAARPRAVIDDKAKKLKESPDLVVLRRKYKMDLLPPPLIVARFFSSQQAAIDALAAMEVAATRDLEEFVEEHGGEDGLLESAKNEKGKVVRANVKELLEALGADPESAEERAALSRCLDLIEDEAAAGRTVNEAQAELDAKVLATYGKLTQAEAKALVIERKWFAALGAALAGEVQRLTEALASRIKDLEERYASSLPHLEQELAAASLKVEAHMRQMGQVW